MKRFHGAFAAALMLAAMPALAQDNTTTTPPANSTQTEQTQTTVPVTPSDSTSSTTSADQNTTTTQANQMAPNDMWYMGQNNEFRASKLIGTSVHNAAGERIGEVNDVLLDNTGKVAAVIIGVGGFLGLGERDVAVNYNAIKMARDDDGDAMLTVDTNKEALTAAPAWTWSKS
jgi:sporulation protein YlmC with PRC-barrel domain